MSSHTPASKKQADSDIDQRRDDAGRNERHQQEQESSPEPTRRPSLTRGAVTGIVALGFGLIASILYSLSFPSAGRVAASALVFSMAALAVGGLLGLLFGVPRTFERDTRPAGESEEPRLLPGIGANTNLEQISDWLTKILVGISLTQLGTIREGAARLFNSMAPSLGGGPNATAFAGGIVAYFSVFGFIGGWLFARLRLGAAMSQADAFLYLARRAEQSGDHKTAEVARAAARSSMTMVQPESRPAIADDELLSLANQYEEVRKTPPGSRRTAEMDALVARAGGLVGKWSITPERVRRAFHSGGDGMRVVALGLMEANRELVDLDAVIDAISNSRSGLEQYHALIVADQMDVSFLSPDQRKELADTIKRENRPGRIKDDPLRSRLAERIQSRIEEIARS
jgi:hypothetical protein